MKRTPKAAALLFAALLPCLGAPVFAEGETQEAVPLTGEKIYVYNWGEYIADGKDGSLDINTEFTRRTGIEVDYSTFDTNESLYSKLVSGGASYDVIIPSDYMVSKMINEGMLEKLNFDNIPNYQYIDEEYRNLSYDPKNEYSVPYTWGLVGIFYNKQYVTEEVDSWDILWDEKYAGKILMFDNPRDAFGIAQKKLGFSFNSTDEDEWIQAAVLLKEQKPLVQAYVMDQIFNKMESGEAWWRHIMRETQLFWWNRMRTLALPSPQSTEPISLWTPCAFQRAAATRAGQRRISIFSAIRRLRRLTWNISATPRRNPPQKSSSRRR